MLCPVIGLNRISSLLGNEHTQLLGSEIISNKFLSFFAKWHCSVQISVLYRDRISYQGTEYRCPLHGGKSFENLLPQWILWSPETDHHFLVSYWYLVTLEDLKWPNEPDRNNLVRTPSDKQHLLNFICQQGALQKLISKCSIQSCTDHSWVKLPEL